MNQESLGTHFKLETKESRKATRGGLLPSIGKVGVKVRETSASIIQPPSLTLQQTRGSTVGLEDLQNCPQLLLHLLDRVAAPDTLSPLHLHLPDLLGAAGHVGLDTHIRYIAGIDRETSSRHIGIVVRVVDQDSKAHVVVDGKLTVTVSVRFENDLQTLVGISALGSSNCIFF